MTDRLKFGIDAANELGDEVAARDAESVLIVTADGVMEAGIIDEILDILPA